ncbi:hypothetical protein NYE69_27145 [Paenibacillus sp. FSL R5-0527]|uniref:hypothetical protein n=1 Tax=Paenibacillus TaxID=44249 RepID=UPI00097B9E80|nr:hypothetical protein [Paenibacillus macerans]MEC0328704.1 hypothetical protein [Paenibacillus macerans]OMG47252.1 hypothetical protein BK140_22340 [Paenibacillus macerans]
MKQIEIIGAELQERTERNGTFSAWYICKACGQEHGCAENEKTQSEARSLALLRFDRQCRNYCYTCGSKLTNKQR